eukprot:gene18338-biopygen5410
MHGILPNPPEGPGPPPLRARPPRGTHRAPVTPRRMTAALPRRRPATHATRRSVRPSTSSRGAARCSPPAWSWEKRPRTRPGRVPHR